MKKIRMIAVCGIFGAISTVLMMLEFSVPLVPSFLKFDFSDLPALITSFACGPVCGGIVCLIKNLLHLPLTQTSGVGELANFIVGLCFVVPAGLFYKFKKTKKCAVLGCLIGMASMTLISFPVNYFITYPFYFHFLPREAVIAAYSAIFPAIDTLEKALCAVNMPFTLVKGAISTGLCLLIYKPLSPIIHGKNNT